MVITATASCLVVALAARAQQQGQGLRIGSSGTLTGSTEGVKETAALKTLQVFIKDETGLANEIQRQKNWRELASKLAKGELQLGVMQGFEYAWAQQEFPELKPLALAVNVYLYPVVYVVERKSDTAASFTDLKGKGLSLATSALPVVELYLKRECLSAGGRLNTFFAKLEKPENVEDALDDVVDGKVQATGVDRAALEGYKRRKPGRFQQLKQVSHSEPLPPAIVCYYDSQLDTATRQRFLDGLTNAHKKEKGEMMLTLFHLTRFEAPPADFNKVLAETRQHYPESLIESK